MKKTLKITLITLVTTIFACSTYKPKQLVQSESHNSVIISESDYNIFTNNKNEITQEILLLNYLANQLLDIFLMQSF